VDGFVETDPGECPILALTFLLRTMRYALSRSLLLATLLLLTAAGRPPFLASNFN